MIDLKKTENFEKLSFLWKYDESRINSDDVARYKKVNSWRGYRISAILLIPCALLKAIYHISAGIFRYIKNKEERTFIMKWSLRSCYQDGQEILGHLYLLAPCCNEKGFTMAATALQHKIHYNLDIENELVNIRLKQIKVAFGGLQKAYTDMLSNNDKTDQEFKKFINEEKFNEFYKDCEDQILSIELSWEHIIAITTPHLAASSNETVDKIIFNGGFKQLVNVLDKKLEFENITYTHKLTAWNKKNNETRKFPSFYINQIRGNLKKIDRTAEFIWKILVNS